MSPIAIQAIQFFISLSFLIVLHELGHFIPAKLFKTRVEKFYLFFDVKYALFKKKIGETEYGIGWLPLGGYVKISGMIDESMDTEAMKTRTTILGISFKTSLAAFDYYAWRGNGKLCSCSDHFYWNGFFLRGAVYS